VIEYFVDYFDTVTIEVPPIDEIELTIEEGIDQVITWPEKFYTLDAVIDNLVITWPEHFYTLDAIIEADEV